MSLGLALNRRANWLICGTALPKLTTDHAEQIAVKPGLSTEVNQGRKHKSVSILWRGRIVALFFISRGSRSSPADYLSKQLYLTTRQAYRLAACSFSADDYYAT